MPIIRACEKHRVHGRRVAEPFRTNGIGPGWFSCQWQEGSVEKGYICTECRWEEDVVVQLPSMSELPDGVTPKSLRGIIYIDQGRRTPVKNDFRKDAESKIAGAEWGCKPGIAVQQRGRAFQPFAKTEMAPNTRLRASSSTCCAWPLGKLSAQTRAASIRMVGIATTVGENTDGHIRIS